MLHRGTGRRALARAIRPYTARQAVVDGQIGAAVEAVRDEALARLAALEAAPDQVAPPPVPAGAVEAQTVIGPLWLAGEDQMITPLIQQYGYWESDLCAYFEAALRPGDTFVDIGANIGYFSIVASRCVGPEGRVYAVEPGERSRRLLQANLWRHGCRNVTVLPVAGYTETGHVQFETNPDGGSGDWVNPFDIKPHATLVPSLALDEVIPGPVHALKSDAQGADHLVLKGMAAALAASPDPRMVVEFLPTLPNLYGDSQADVLALYRQMGFGLFFLTPTGEPYPVGEDEVMGTGADVLNLCLQRV